MARKPPLIELVHPITKQQFRDIVRAVRKAGYRAAIDWSENIEPPANAREFAGEAIYVICNSGMRNSVALGIFEKCMMALNTGESCKTVFGHPGKSSAIDLWLFMTFFGLGWRETFIVTGLFGAALLGLWWWLFSSPRDTTKVTTEELAWIEHDPPETIEQIGWGQIVRRREAWAYSSAKFLTDPVWFLMLFWLPSYFSNTYNVDLKVVVLPMIAMYLLSDVGSIAGGWLSSRLLQAGRTVNFARKVTMLLAAVCVTPLIFVTSLDNMWLAVVLIGVALAGHQAFSTNLLSLPPDMFPKRAVGSVIGLGGFAGGIGGMIMAKSTGLVLDATGGDYTMIFAACTVVYFLAILSIHLLSPNLAKAKV